MCHAIRQGQTGQLVTDLHRLKQGDVIAPMLFNNFLDSICRYIESKTGELGLKLGYSIDGHLIDCRIPNDHICSAGI